eukprot:9489761-Pyramimonas_sp.AAC.1
MQGHGRTPQSTPQQRHGGAQPCGRAPREARKYTVSGARPREACGLAQEETRPSLNVRGTSPT